MNQIKAPFTPDQVSSLNAFQVSGVMHPFTCGNGGHDHGVLRAAEDGWHCEKCDYTQDWAHDWMASAPSKEGDEAGED